MINLLWLARRYAERFWDEPQEGVLHLQEHRYDFLRGRNESRWTFVHPDGSRSELVHSLRTYAPHELAAMLNGRDSTSRARGATSTAPRVSFESRRLILRGRKPPERPAPVG